MENNNLPNQNRDQNNDLPENTQKKDEKKNKTEKNTKKSKMPIILSVVLTLVISLIAVVAFLLINKPDNGATAPPPFDTAGLNETIPGLNELPEGEEPLPTDTVQTDATQTTAPPEKPIDPESIPKSEQDIYNFLFVGQDRIALNTDVIMLVNFNTTTNKIAVLQIPRDTYIQLGYYNGKINGLFAYHYITNKNDTKVALRKFADDLEQNLCIKIHNIAHINLDGVCSVVDTLGGVDVNLPSPITYYDTRSKKNVTLNAGVQHLDGYAAEQFIRHRSSYLQADIGRIDAQKIFVSGLLKKVKTNFNATTIIPLTVDFFKYVTTDINLADGVFFAKNLLNVSMSDIKFMSMMGCGAGSNPDGTGLSLYVMVRKNMREMIDTYFNIYDFPITDGIFDKNMVFSSKTIFPHIHKYYIRQDFVTSEPYNAQNINDDSISIPRC